MAAHAAAKHVLNQERVSRLLQQVRARPASMLRARTAVAAWA